MLATHIPEEGNSPSSSGPVVGICSREHDTKCPILEAQIIKDFQLKYYENRLFMLTVIAVSTIGR